MLTIIALLCSLLLGCVCGFKLSAQPRSFGLQAPRIGRLAAASSRSNGNDKGKKPAIHSTRRPPPPRASERNVPVDTISQELSSNDVSYIRLVPPPRLQSSKPTVEETMDFNKFGTLFRHSAPYIAMHRGTVMVLHVSGSLLKNRHSFDSIMDDLSILHLLGIKLVLVVGVRDQLDGRLRENGADAVYCQGMRITDELALKLLKEEAGKARCEIESALARGFRGMTGNSGINVVSGNFFYTAKPLGVRDGVDFKNTGEVRRVEVENFKRRLDGGDVIMLTSVGYSTSGEVFSVPSESLAAECAARLKAAKIIYITAGESMEDTRSGKKIQSLRLAQTCALLGQWGMRPNQYNYVERSDEDEEDWDAEDRMRERDAAFALEELEGLEAVSQQSYPNMETLEATSVMSNIASDYANMAGMEATSVMSNIAIASNIANSKVTTSPLSPNKHGNFIRLLARCVYALTAGVRRAHLIAPDDGALLKELFTRDGSGILISRDMYEGARPARDSDLRSIMEIINPLVEEGILAPRTKEDVRSNFPDTFVLALDGAIVACGVLKRYSPTSAEIACVAVHPQYRRGGRGELLLAYLERRALLMGVTQVFVLSTRTMQWFEERGFRLSSPSLLPATRNYNAARASKVYIKDLGTTRDVEVEELLWDIA
ncbi:Aspartate/glutamate/uridylate kinase [Ochromonadaceae sp. CCMP2298]|nr:Aspartate/glutamate/uridylate kinase [Ochromonadaceae sp. CCMP2298]|mmetsp:Transcript_29966/g.66292  ORF Transcript_29966/g.66292 Transcript_29966/m.66292 type:complete len:658 (-) Transcript_29966:242-2215(-)